MNESDALEDLMARNVTEVVAWLDCITDDVHDAISGFNWLGLAEGARARTVESVGLNNCEKLLWADVAIKAWKRAETFCDLSEAEVLDNEVSLRCYLITTVGRTEGVQLLDPQFVWNILRSRVSLSLDQVREMSHDWRTLNRKQILDLRRIKNLLSSVSLLPPEVIREIDDGNGGIDQWIDLLPILP